MIDTWEAIAWLCIAVGVLLLMLVAALTREGDDMFGLAKREPVMVGAVAQALVTLGAIVGLHLTAEQATALITVGGLVIGLIARMHVTPVAKS